jgi:hypothetical protein
MAPRENLAALLKFKSRKWELTRTEATSRALVSPDGCLAPVSALGTAAAGAGAPSVCRTNLYPQALGRHQKIFSLAKVDFDCSPDRLLNWDIDLHRLRCVARLRPVSRCPGQKDCAARRQQRAAAAYKNRTSLSF